MNTQICFIFIRILIDQCFHLANKLDIFSFNILHNHNLHLFEEMKSQIAHSVAKELIMKRISKAYEKKMQNKERLVIN